MEDLIDVQKRINTAMERNTEALKKLYTGPENIISKIKIQDLGAKTTKQIDEESIEELLKNNC